MMQRNSIVLMLASILVFGTGCPDDAAEPRPDRVGGDADTEVQGDIQEVPADTPDVDDTGETPGARCTTDEDCNDNLFCNGTERCESGRCASGTDPCQDRFDCTVDSCLEDLDRCSHTPDHQACQNGLVCDGAEVCDPARGCQRGSLPDCRDASECTIDRCDEARGGCVHDPRDIDGDTHVAQTYRGENCGGDDCNDGEASIRPGVPEICGDGQDNDCDTSTDLQDTECRPQVDTCAGALLLAEGVVTESSTAGAVADYRTACGSALHADVVFEIELAQVVDVIVTVTSRGGTLFADLQRAPCGGGVASSLGCMSGTSITLRRNRLEPGSYFVVVKAAAATDFSISYTTAGPTPVPPNDTCAGVVDIDLSVGTVHGTLFDTADHYVPGCSRGHATYNDVFYRLVLTAPHKITITAEMSPPTSRTYVSLMRTCGVVATEIACASGSTATITRNFLDAGTYYVAVDADASTPFTLSVRLEPPIYPPANDRCSGATDVGGGGLFQGSLAETYRDYPPSCSTDVRLSDVVYRLVLSEPADVSVTVSPIGAAATYVAAMRTTCDSLATEIACRSGNPAQFTRRSLAAGTYYIIVSGPATTANQFLLRVVVGPPTPVPPGDACGTAVDISAGGTFTGTTVRTLDDFAPSCDAAATFVDTVYRFTLASPQDLTLGLASSAASNNLELRSGPCGGGVVLRCVSGASPSIFYRSLPAGEYWVLVDTSIEASYTLTVSFGPPTTACDGAIPIQVDYAAGGTFTFSYSGTTSGRPADFTPVDCVDGTGPDMVFRLVIPVRSAVTIRSTTTDWDGALYLRSDCMDPRSQIDCNDDCGSTRESCLPQVGTGALTLEAGTYYIIQDAYTTGSGSFTLNVRATRL